MKVKSLWRHSCRNALVIALAAGWTASAFSAPPSEVREDDRNVFKRVGGFLFKKTRDLEKSQEAPKPLPPPNQANATRGKTSAKKTPSGVSAAGQPIPGVNPGRRGETQYLREDPSGLSQSEGAERSAGADGKSKGDKGAEKTVAGGSEAMGPPAPLSYAVPVAGRVGFVYPPGAERTEANMLDVRGLAPGQKARDPRTGNMFLVP